MEDVYNCSDQIPSDTVALKVKFLKEASSTCSDVILFRKVMARASGRYSGARPGDDVVYIKGGALSGGIGRYWRSIVPEGSIAVLANVNKDLFEKTGADPRIKVEVIETETDSTDAGMLLEERERLLKRLAEINELLGGDL